MVYVINENEEILNKCDAWVTGAEKKRCEWADQHGYKVTSIKITCMGDMVIMVDE